ncbi:MAG: threonylcarbamoyl-AMP synthase [Candidatus Kerfeldbacteria bacterium]|nr:threonylcarbamoyl-AMP synthase [Candidatus Kerfeldbacteria bacterium]
MIRCDVQLDDWHDLVQNAFHHHGVVIMPTDTVYGFSCDARDREAVEKIFELKHRPESRPLLVLASNLEMVKSCSIVSEEFEEWIAQYWPGPLTTILEARPGIFAPEGLAFGSTVAIRIPSSGIARECVELNGAPLISSSVNRSGHPPLRTIRQILAEFASSDPRPDVLLDAGDIPDVLPTTIVDCVRSPWRIVRNGSLIPIFPHVT